MTSKADTQQTIRMAPKTRTITLICGLLLTACLALSAEKPNRVVSINVCTDQLLVMLVGRKRIASLSHLATDPHTSWIVEEAQDLHLNHGIAEEVMALTPDLIVTAAFSFRPTVATLRQLGYTVVEIQLASSLEEIKTNLLALGQAVGEIERAKTLIAAFDSELERLIYRDGGRPPLFAHYDANGWTAGRNTLIADVASAAGFETLGDRLGFSGTRHISLEQLLILQPDLLDLGYAWAESPALVSERLKHPALTALLENTVVAEVPGPAWACGSPHILEALAHLRQIRDRFTTLERQDPL